MAQPAGKDNTQLFGWIGIVTGICCGIVGAIFGVLSIMQAKKFGNSPVLGYVAIAISVITVIANIIYQATR